MENNLSMEEKISNSILMYITKDKEIDRIKYLKCKLGIEIITINLFKLISMYCIAYILGLTMETLLFHISFMIIRTFAYGYHSKTSRGCTIFSILTLVGIPYLITFKFLFQRKTLLLLGLFNVVLVALFAPKTTQKNNIKSKKHKKELKIRAITASLLIILFSLFQGTKGMNLIIIGSLLAGLFIIPINRKEEAKWKK